MGDSPTIAGRVLADKYLLIDRLGVGGFGSIWRAEHQVLKSHVAVKLIDPEMARKEGAVERFLREAQATAALRSPHVVQVLDYGLDRRKEPDDPEGEEVEQPFIVMELLDGENLAERIERIGALAPLEVVRVVTHIARAIGRAHELGIVHRDLKPENIFLVNNGDDEIAKVLDFGVAKFASPLDLNLDTYTQTGSLVGTPYYMSPEQAQGNKTVDHRSDLWALGVIAFEMMLGKRPFDSDALGDLVLRICVRDLPVPSDFGPVPAGFDGWFAKAAAREPSDRFQSARELALALIDLIESADGDVRFTQFDDRLAASREPPRVSAKPSELGFSAEIPSRPVHSAFAATVRDDAPFSTRLPIEAADEAPPPEERLTPTTLAGMALLALAAGAAAVYGIYHLLRGPDSESGRLVVVTHQDGRDESASGKGSRVKGDARANRPGPSSDAIGRGPNEADRPSHRHQGIGSATPPSNDGPPPAAAMEAGSGGRGTSGSSMGSPTDFAHAPAPAAQHATGQAAAGGTTGGGATSHAAPAADPEPLKEPVNEPPPAPASPLDSLPMVTDPT